MTGQGEYLPLPLPLPLSHWEPSPTWRQPDFSFLLFFYMVCFFIYLHVAHHNPLLEHFKIAVRKQMLLFHSRLYFRSGGRQENEWRKERNLRDECVFPWLWALFHLTMRTKSPKKEKKDPFRSVCSPGNWTGHFLFMSWYVERRNIGVFCCRMPGFVYSHIVFLLKTDRNKYAAFHDKVPALRREPKIFPGIQKWM